MGITSLSKLYLHSKDPLHFPKGFHKKYSIDVDRSYRI